MITASLERLQSVTRGQLMHADKQLQARVSSVAIDSRKVVEGSLFVAIKGERVDGHEYLQQAANQGAALALVEQVQDIDFPQLLVSDVVLALAAIAHDAADAFAGKITAITGSSGKTSTKEMLVSILQQSHKVAFTQGNQNNELGVPLTIFAIADDADMAVIEMGAAQKGDIRYLTDMASPDVSVITNVGNAHIERFGSEAVIAETKGEIYQALKAGAVGVVNLDDKYAGQWLASLKEQQVVSFSLRDTSADVCARNIELAADSVAFDLCYGGNVYPVALQVAGEHNIANALAAAACALSQGVTVDDVLAGLNAFRPVGSRLQVLPGVWGGCLIDDCYNANPNSVKAAIDVLAEHSVRRILVLGDMGELGDQAKALHADVGAYAKQQGVDVLLTCGVLSTAAAQAFGDDAKHFEDKASLTAYLLNALDSDEVVLVKGSRTAALETVVKQLKKEDCA